MIRSTEGIITTMLKKKRFWKIAWLAGMLAWAVSGYYLFLYKKTYTKEQIDKMFAPITSKYGIRIEYQIGNDFFSNIDNPPIPAGPDRNSEVKPIAHQQLSKYPFILQRALAKYPDHVIKKYLTAIYFAGKIELDGFNVGGTYDPFRHVIYLVNNGRQTDDFAESVFHHEFSSLLILGNSFFLNPWIDHNPKNYKYLDDIYDNWKVMRKNVRLSTKGKDEDYEKGFMDSYGQTSFENDFNEYSAMIFTYPEKFKNIMNRYPRVRAKFLVWLNYYHKIDPIFTEEYFLGQSRK
jgi:hypothetical protein